MFLLKLLRRNRLRQKKKTTYSIIQVHFIVYQKQSAHITIHYYACSKHGLTYIVYLNHCLGRSVLNAEVRSVRLLGSFGSREKLERLET